ncbi:MAG: DUF2393 domain-containing protein [Bryobacteraceae bacterium]|nr:DUF2393 domain-containing protein [Bryobacteraceae bacterium]
MAPRFLAALLAIAVVGGAAYWLSRPVATPAPAKITAEAKAYVKHLTLGEIAMTAAEAFNGAKLIEIKGQIGNQGTRPLRQVEITCIFYDPYGQVVGRERQPIVRAATGGLKPGETKPFRLAFDSLAESWNQALPQVVIASIDFE